MQYACGPCVQATGAEPRSYASMTAYATSVRLCNVCFAMFTSGPLYGTRSVAGERQGQDSYSLRGGAQSREM